MKTNFQREFAIFPREIRTPETLLKKKRELTARMVTYHESLFHTTPWLY